MTRPGSFFAPAAITAAKHPLQAPSKEYLPAFPSLHTQAAAARLELLRGCSSYCHHGESSSSNICGSLMYGRVHASLFHIDLYCTTAIVPRLYRL